MSLTNKIRRSLRGEVALIFAGALVAVAALAGLAGGAWARGSTDAVGQPPPEWAVNAGSWPAHNFDLANSRANMQSDIDSTNVATLKRKWSFKLPYVGLFGAFTSNPIVLDGLVYLQDPDSNVYALSEETGAVVWKHRYNSPTPSGGPNGVAIGYGLLFGATARAQFALNLKTGKQVWIRSLVRNSKEGIDMAPQLYDGKVLVSTIPGNAKAFYKGNSYGIVYALDARTGKIVWRFSTVQGGNKLWGDPKLNGGGGLWYPPSVDNQGRVFLAVANPAPWPNAPGNPNAKSRPGPNLYTDSLVALDGRTGNLLWYRQVTRHDVRDYDFQASPIVSTQSINGARTEIVIGAGKSGKVVAFRADNGKRLWTLNIGRHKNDEGLLPAKKVLVCPGPLGGVETPMAQDSKAVYVPWVDACVLTSSTGLGALNFAAGKGGLAAVSPVTGAVLWKRAFKSIDVGAATVANDVVFTSTLDGTSYGLSTKDGSVLWSAKARSGINSFPAVTKNMLIVGAGAPSAVKNPTNEVIAYSLP
jgi:outer membrane protein assembly factor BamB